MGRGARLWLRNRPAFCLIFSLAANDQFRHKIILERSETLCVNHWLGVTFRTSKTFIDYRAGGVFFENGHPLRLATEDEARTYSPLRRQENLETGFNYPPLSFSISASDLIPPRNPN